MLSECQELVVSAGETVGTDGQAVTITSVPQAAFTDHGVQYQFRTENNGGQVRRKSFCFLVLQQTGEQTVLACRTKINSALRLQVTYRVVQVTEDQLEATAEATGAVSVVSAAAFAGAPQAVAQVGPETTQTAVTRFWIRGSS